MTSDKFSAIDDSKPRHSSRVLVLGNDCGAFLSVVRSLGRAGLEVHGAYWNIDTPGFASCYLAGRHLLPPPAPLDDCLATITELLAGRSFDMVIPTNEQAARLLQTRSPRLTPWRHILPLNEETTFATAFDKIESWRLAERLGLKTPRGEVVDSVIAAIAAAERIGFPLVLKPRSSYDDNLFDRRNVAHVADARVLATTDSAFSKGPLLVQEYFAGIGVGVELLAHQGRILFAFQHRRVHEPRGGGGSSYRVSEPLNAELLEAASKLVAALSYDGVMMVEFLRDPTTSDWRFVEINARFWGSLPLALAAGADFPRYWYESFIGRRREFPSAYRVGIGCRNTIGELKWIVTNLCGRSDARIAMKPRRLRAAWELLLFPYRMFQANDTLVRDDPRPAVVEFVGYLRRATRNLGDQIRAARHRLPWVRAREHANATALWKSARSVLFVCLGNICRSPFAQRYLASRDTTGRRARSTGMLPRRGRTSPPEAIAAAAEWGVTLADHESAITTAAEVAAAEIIVVFDEAIRRELVRRFPEAAGRTVMFGCLSASGPVEVADPFGKPPAAFQGVYRQIAEVFDGLSSQADPSERRSLETASVP